MEARKPDLNTALFPVNIVNLYIEIYGNKQGSLFVSEGKMLEVVKRFKAIVAKDNSYVFSVVGPDYKLVTNQQAVELGKICFSQVFKLTDIKQMQVYNIIMPKTRSFCHLDFIHEKAQFDPFEKDPWMPYLRVTNSYNRTFALNFDLGFCRWICRNGIIFGKKNIVFKYYHIKSTSDPKVEFNLRAGELAKLEVDFVETLLNLKRFHVPRKVMWALACKVLHISVHEVPTDRQQELLNKKQEHIAALTERYFGEHGENGYAALNVLTDFASRPIGVISPESCIDAMQRQAGNWMADFVEAIESRSFTFQTYLGDYAQLAG